MFPRSALVAMSIAVMLTAPPTAGHPEATLRAARASAPAGSVLPVTGENFTANGLVQLILRGALEEHRLNEVTATAEGTLALGLEIPATVRPGRYQLVALADDGDVVARLDLVMEAPLTPTGDGEATGGEDAQQAGEPETTATAEDLPIERSRSGAEWGIIGLLVGLAGGWGLGLMRRPV